MNRFIKALLVCFTLIASPIVIADIVVVVNASSSIATIKKSDLARVFLGKSNQVPGAGKVAPINQVSASPVREKFDMEMLNRTPAQMKSYWSRQLFSGEGSPPEEVNNDAAMLQHLGTNTKAVGYIDSAALNDTVKVVTITE